MESIATLSGLMESMAPHPGQNRSPLPGVSFQKFTRSLPRSPAVYQPSIKFIGMGRMQSHLGQEVFTYDVDHYLIVGFPLPVECQFRASLAKPLVFLSLDLDWTAIGTLVAELGEMATPTAGLPKQAIRSTPLGGELRQSVTRLVECLRSPTDARVLGPSLVREVYYRVLCGPQGEILRAAAAKHGGYAKIGKALNVIHKRFAERPSITDLARSAGMSLPVFHRHFQSTLGISPGRYLQAIRLHKARSLIVHENLNASQAAARVGYESPSQFSREFRRLFGASPSDYGRQTRSDRDTANSSGGEQG